MRPSALLFMYRRRLKAHRAQELFAGVGIAIAVALVFAAILAEGSISGSAGRVVHTVIGPADLQLRARGGEGFSEATNARVKRLPGVKQAAPLLEQTATVTGASGRQISVEVAGTDLRLAVLDGLAETLPIGSLSTNGIALSQASAQALGIGHAAAKHAKVTLKLRGRAFALPVSAVLGAEAAGALSGARVAVMPLSHLQQLAGLPGRVTRVFVQSKPDRQATVRAELTRLASGRLEVAPADADIALLRQALGPSDLASGLFASIGAVLGFLLAFNAMLLTVTERRRAIADLRIAGARRATIAEMVLFEALCLGIPASLLGLGAGYLLSTGVFHQSTNYLAEAFTLSGGTVVSTRAVLLSLLGGILATCLASAVPLLDLRRGRARDAIYEERGVPGSGLNRRLRTRLAVAALCLVAGATALWTLLPAAAIPATALLALATVLAVPLAFAAVLRGADALGERLQRISILPLALSSLRATTLRSLALAATGAVALFGSVALGGSRANLLSGINSFAHSYVADADIWVSNPGDNQAVNSFSVGVGATRNSRLPAGDARHNAPLSTGDLARIASLPAVASVQTFQGGFTQLGNRRVWVIARPPGAARHVLESQILDGNAATALARLTRGGWIAVSAQIATEHHVRLGGTLVLATPTGPQPFRIAATTTNLAWPPGVIFMSAANYSRAWATTDPTALGVQLRPGANAAAARGAIETALGPASGLEVSLAATRAARIDALASEGLGQLREISTMLLLAAIVAMVAALASSTWQRRSGLAGLRLFGATSASLQGILLIEATLMLSAGCLTGALAGAYGQVVIDAFLRHVTGFPLASPTAGVRPLEILLLVLAAALALGAIPGWLASRVRPVLALADE
jgi:putative ABC transport system permease protein